MAGAVEFVISMKDQISGGLSKIANEFSAAKKNADTLTGSIGSLRSKGETLRIARDSSTSISEIKRLNAEIAKTESRIDSLTSSGKSVGSSLKGAFESLQGGAFLTNPIVAATAGIGAIAKLGMDVEQTNIQFEVLLGSQSKAAALLNEMNDYAAKTPYEKLDLQDAAKTMLAFGIAQDRIMPNMKMLGDVAMGNKEKLSSLTLAFSQISSAGKMQGQDFLQLINAGFNPLKEISKMTGRSMADLKKDMEKGNISAEMVSKAFEHATSKGGIFYGMTEKVGRSMGGRFSTLIDTAKERMLDLFGVIAPVLSPAIDLLTGLLSGVGVVFKALVGWMKEGNPVFLAFAAIIGAVTAAYILYNVWQKLTATWVTVMTFLKGGEAAAWWAATVPMLITVGVIAAIILAISTLVLFIVYCVKHVTGWGQTWQNIVTYMGLAFEVFKIKMKLIWLGIKNDFLSGFEIIAKGWYKLQSLWDKGAAKKGLAAIEADRNNRAQEMAAENGKADKLKKQMSSMSVWALKTDGTSFGKLVKDSTKSILPGVPGAAAAGADGEGGGDNKKNNKKTTEAVASGGTRNTQITINLGKMVENIVFNGGVSENSNELTRQVEEVLLRVLYAAQSAG